MKRFFITLIMALSMIFAVSCKTTENIGDITFGASSMKIFYTMDITQRQLDSICEADILPDYNQWIKAKFTDFETNKVYVKRMYFKSYSEYNEVIYILVGEKAPYKITKRIAE